MSKLLQGNALTYDNQSHFWIATDSPHNYNSCIIESSYRKRWEGVKIIYNLNEEGYRAKDWDKIDWSQSVVMLGDSCTLGVGVQNKDTVTEQLSMKLGKPVINLGVGGSSNLFMLYNAAKVIEHFNPWGMIIQWSTAERFPRFSKPHTGNSGIRNMGSWSFDDIYYKINWVKGDNFLYHDEYIKQTARQLNINRFLDYVPESWNNDHDTENTLPWIPENDKNDYRINQGDPTSTTGDNYARDNLHPSGVIYKKWAKIIANGITENDWMDKN